MSGRFIALISISALSLLSSCSFLSHHAELIEDIKAIEKKAIDDASSDLKKEIDKQKAPDAKVSPAKDAS